MSRLERERDELTQQLRAEVDATGGCGCRGTLLEQSPHPARRAAEEVRSRVQSLREQVVQFTHEMAADAADLYDAAV